LKIPNVGPFPILIGTNVKKLAQKDSMIVDVYQFNDSGKPTGGLTFQLSGRGLIPKVKVTKKIIRNRFPKTGPERAFNLK